MAEQESTERAEGRAAMLSTNKVGVVRCVTGRQRCCCQSVPMPQSWVRPGRHRRGVLLRLLLLPGPPPLQQAAGGDGAARASCKCNSPATAGPTAPAGRACCLKWIQQQHCCDTAPKRHGMGGRAATLLPTRANQPLTRVEHACAVQDLRYHPALALAQRPADVHAHSVAHIAVVVLVVCLGGVAA